MTGGGGQLLLVCGVVVLQVVGGCFVCGRRLLQHKGGGRDRVRGKGNTGRQNSERDVQRVRYVPRMGQTWGISLVTSSL